MALQYEASAALAHLVRQDDRMAELIDTAGAFAINVRPDRSVFEALFRSIIFQQLSDRAAATIYGRVHALLGADRPPTPDRVLARDDEALRGAGMSYAKIRAARDLAEKTKAGLLPPLDEIKSMSDEEVIDALTVVRGIGPWTVQMLLIFHLGRPDVLPLTDLGVRKGFMFTYETDELPTHEMLAAHGERWRPYRSVASWYLWRAVALNTGTAPPAL